MRPLSRYKIDRNLLSRQKIKMEKLKTYKKKLRLKIYQAALNLKTRTHTGERYCK